MTTAQSTNHEPVDDVTAFEDRCVSPSQQNLRD